MLIVDLASYSDYLTCVCVFVCVCVYVCVCALIKSCAVLDKNNGILATVCRRVCVHVYIHSFSGYTNSGNHACTVPASDVYS